MSDIIIIFVWQIMGSIESLPFRFISMSSWEKVGLHLMSAGKLNNNLSPVWICFHASDLVDRSSDSCTKVKLFLLGVICKHSYVKKEKKIFYSVCHLVSGLSPGPMPWTLNALSWSGNLSSSWNVTRSWRTWWTLFWGTFRATYFQSGMVKVFLSISQGACIIFT